MASSPGKEGPSSPRKEGPSSPRKEGPSSPRKEGPATPRKVKEISADSRLLKNVRKNVRCYVNKNGTDGGKTTPVVATSLEMLLSEATGKLSLTRLAKKAFDRDGKQILEFDDVKPDMIVFVSTGEPFLTKENASSPAQATVPAVSSKLFGEQPVMLKVHRNGEVERSVQVVSGPLEQFLTRASARLSLPNAARRAYDENGKVLNDASLKALARGSDVYVTSGEAFKRPGEGPTTTSPSAATKAFGADYNTVMAEVCKNGVPDFPVTIVVRGNMGQFLADCTGRLNLPSAGRKLFSAEGKAITDHKTIERGQRVFVSCGEPFIQPGDGDSTPRVNEIDPSSRLLQAPRKTVTVMRNGDRTQSATVVCSGSLEQLCTDATGKLSMPSACRRIFTEDGREVTDNAALAALDRGAVLFASVGEPFRNPDRPVAVELSCTLSPTSRIYEEQVAAARPPVTVFLNGKGSHDNQGRVIVAASYDVLKQEATKKLRPPCGPVRFFFAEDGSRIPEDITQLSKGQVIFASCGEKFIGRAPPKKKPGA